MTDVQVNGHREDSPPLEHFPRSSRAPRHLVRAPARRDRAQARARPRRRRHRDTQARRGTPADRARAPADAGRDLGTAYKYLDAARFHVAFHALRSPKYLAWSVVVGHRRRRPARQGAAAWWWVTESRRPAVQGRGRRQLARVAVAALARHQARARGAARASAPSCSRVVLALVLVDALAPWWAWFVVAAIVVPPLAHYGRPDHRPIVQSAVTTPLVRKISTDAIVRAYESAGLCTTDPKKPADHLGFGSTMTRDALDKGSRRSSIYLPYRRDVRRRRQRQDQDRLRARRGRVAGLFHQGQAVRTAAHAARARRRPAVRARRPDAAARLQAALHLAEGPVRPRPVRPQGRVLPDVDEPAHRRPAAARQDVRRPPAGPVRRARPVRRHHAHRRQEQPGLAAAQVRGPPVHPGHAPDQGR